MLFTVVKQNTYQDSINLMLLTNRINTLEGVIQSSIMMGTDANRDIFRNTGLLTHLQKKNWAAFARIYNGPSYAARGYHTRMAAAYRKYAGKSK